MRRHSARPRVRRTCGSTSVGLRSSRFDSVAPRRLAESTSGAYSEASSPEELERIFSALGAELSNGYMVRYRSLAGPEEPVDVQVSVEGFGTASTSYTSPPLEITSPGHAGNGGGWSSTLATVLAAGVMAGLLGLSLFALLWRRRSTPRERVAQFVSPQPENDPSRSLTGRLAAGQSRGCPGPDGGMTSRWSSTSPRFAGRPRRWFSALSRAGLPARAARRGHRNAVLGPAAVALRRWRFGSS